MLVRRCLLVLLFLLAQAGTLAHGIGHFSDRHTHDDDGADHEPVCELCLAFAPMGAGMASVPPVWTPPESIPLFDAAVPAASPSVFQTACRNRGPPRLTW